jgi:putative ABC transport system ATP-binding protein
LLQKRLPNKKSEMKDKFLINICGLRRVYTIGKVNVTALSEIDLQIQPGQFVGITGASGSGKSTLLNLIAGLDTPTSGDIIFEGTAISDLNREDLALYRRQKVGMIFQSFNLINSYTAVDNVALPLFFAGIGKNKRRQKASDMLAILGLDHRKNHKPLEMSGGEQQRVAIARSLINEPRVLLADEPTGNLDSGTAGEILEILSQLNQENNLTIIMVSHESDLLQRSADTIVNLHDGAVAEIKEIK